MHRARKLVALLTLLALVASACGGGSGDDAATSETAAPETTASTTTAAPETTTTTTTTTAAPETTTTTTTTIAEVVETADSETVAEYCTALDDIDAFFDADFPVEADLPAAIDEQQAIVEAMVPPSSTLESAHDSYSGAFLEFFDVFESNNYDISDAEIEDIFSGIDVTLAAAIIENWREDSCTGSGSETTETGEVSATFGFEIGQCVNQVSNGDFEEVACDTPHDYQAYYVFDVPDAEDYPGESELVAVAETNCLEQYEPFIGVSFQSSLYQVTTLRPGPTSWPFGDREIVCLVHAASGQVSQDLQGIGE